MTFEAAFLSQRAPASVLSRVDYMFGFLFTLICEINVKCETSETKLEHTVHFFVCELLYGKQKIYLLMHSPYNKKWK